MAMRIPMGTRNALASAFAALPDAGAGPGYVEVRTGAQPATGDDAAAGTLLGTLTLSDPAFGAPADAVLTANAITSDEDADASGEAGWFRAFDSDGNSFDDGSVTGEGGGGDMELDDVNIVAGGTIAVSSWTVTVPGA